MGVLRYVQLFLRPCIQKLGHLNLNQMDESAQISEFGKLIKQLTFLTQEFSKQNGANNRRCESSIYKDHDFSNQAGTN